MSSQPGLEGTAICFRNLQCRSGTGMVLSAFLDGDFATVMLNLSYFYIHIYHHHTAERAGRSLS